MLNPDQVIELSITVTELQIVMTALGELPYRASAPVIDKVRQQVMAIDPEAFGARPLASNGAIQPSRGSTL